MIEHPPRPALRKAADGAIHTATPSVARMPEPSSAPLVAGDSPAGSAGSKSSALQHDKQSHGGKKHKKKSPKRRDIARTVEPEPVATRVVTVQLATDLYRRALEQAEADGRTLPEAVAHLVRVWADG